MRASPRTTASSVEPVLSYSSRMRAESCHGLSTNARRIYLRVYFAQIRRKLEPDPARPRYFITEARMSYRFTGN